ncbi:MFS family permease [Enterococcus sp. PF1-24]|uniref:MFS transporter n=1 Tax=unclassified Enterococcus TaxID=2608891 RepID=UPI002476BC31|nr:MULTISPECIES: MFS transporter [unclassified Enterococcus]MDH6364270.1 MFS family permease [Enterococcus sp. PFB1-1]MDH6401371.1 MFS family permease [Enterococcus sp. PF1-24]
MKNNKNVLFLLLGQVISVFGGAILRFALSLYVLDQTGRADIFATILAISSIPVLFSPIGGAIADRYDRRNLMVLMDVANAVLAGMLLLVLGGGLSVWLIGALLFVLSFVGSFDTPVVQASIPLLVPENELEKVNGLVTGVLSLSNVAAPIIGGVLYGIFGAQALVAFSIVFFIIAAVIESFLKIPFEKKVSEAGMVTTLKNDLVAGFHEVRKNKIISKSIFIAALVNFLLVPFFIVGLPIILRMVLQANDTVYGIGMSLVSVASIIGAIFAMQITKRIRFNNFYLTFTISGVLLIVMSFGLLFAGNTMGNNIGLFFLVITGVPIGILLSAISIYLISVVQRITPRGSLGKVMATIAAVSQGAVPVGQLLMGVLFKQTNSSVLLPMLIISLLILAVSFLCYRLFKETKDSDIIPAKD